IDTYLIRATAGDTLTVTTATPGDGTGEPQHTLDPQLELLNPSGTVVATDNNGAADGRNARLVYSVPSDGTYRVIVRPVTGDGPYILTVDGATGGVAPFTVTGSTPGNGALLTNYPGTYRIDLSSAVLLPTVDANDLLVNGVAADSVSIIDPDTLEFTI